MQRSTPLDVAPGVVIGASVIATGTVLGLLLGGEVGALVLGVGSLAFAVPFARAVASGRPYAGRGGLWRLIIDATWSSLNTWGGAVYYGVHRIFGNTHEPEKSAGRGSIWLTKGVVPKYATTIGPVKAGSHDRVDFHEEIHVFQARLFGPFYMPLVVLNYIVGTIVPYWLLFRDKERYPITGFVSYFENGVYPHVWNELWAYRVAEQHRARSGTGLATESVVSARQNVTGR